MKNPKTLLNTFVVEKITQMPTDRQLTLHTRWIATNGVTPIITFGTEKAINPHCHVHEAYSPDYFKPTTQT